MSHLLHTLQKNFSVEPKSYTTKPREMSWSQTSKTRVITTKKARASRSKEKDCCFILQPKADREGSKKPFRGFRWIGPYLVEKVLPNNEYFVRKLNTNKIQIFHRIRLRTYNPGKPPEDHYQETHWQIDDNIVIPKMIYTPLHGKRNLVDIYLTFLSHIRILTRMILMKVTRRDQILSLFRAPTFMIQAMVETGKLARLLTQPSYILQILKHMVKVKTLRPPQIYIVRTIPHKHLSQIRTLKLHIKLRNNQHGDRVTTLQRSRSTTLIPKLFRQTNLVFLEAENTTCALILSLITQKYTDNVVCKILFKPPSYAFLILYI